MSCIFCKIVKGEIPCLKVLETSKTLAFMDINPIAKGHVLIIPKEHAAFMHQLSDESMADIGVTLKRVAKAVNVDTEYNVLQNNGKLAHQEVMHVHFHVIPKRDRESGLGIGWPTMSGVTQEQLAEQAKQISARIE